MTINSNQDAALKQAAQGWPVVPLHDGVESSDTNNTADNCGQDGNVSRTAVRAGNADDVSPTIADDVDGSDGCRTGVPFLLSRGQNYPATNQAGKETRLVRTNKRTGQQPTTLPDFILADGKEKDSDRLIRLAGSAFVFHNHDREPFASVVVNGRVETWAIRSGDFKDWLTHQFWIDAEGAPSGNGMKDALGVLAAKAKFVGPTIRVNTRVAEYEGNIYLDLADEERRVVEITTEGWSVTTDAPVHFRRPKGMRSLPVPVPGGKVEDLRQFLNVPGETDWMLLVGWILAAVRPQGPYPLAALHGEHGSAKTTTARILRQFVDPNFAPVRSEPRDGRDLMISASNGWVIALDNLSKVSDSLSDGLCRLSTGGGFATRTLHTDTDETIIEAQRPVILTGIEELATRGDLLDRSLVITLPAINSGDRKTEREFWAEFAAAQPRILGALLTVVAGALRELPYVDQPHLPRLADFAVWVTAAEPTLGWERGAFLKAFVENRHQANSVALEASLLATPVLKLIEKGPWFGTAEQLLRHVEASVPDSVRRNPEWPRTARGMGGALRRLSPNLRPLGIQVTFDRESRRDRTRNITIARL